MVYAPGSRKCCGQTYANVTALIAELVIKGESIPWKSACAPSARTVERRQSSPPLYWARPACSRTFTVSNGCPKAIATLPLMKPPTASASIALVLLVAPSVPSSGMLWGLSYCAKGSRCDGVGIDGSGAVCVPPPSHHWWLGLTARSQLYNRESPHRTKNVDFCFCS